MIRASVGPATKPGRGARGERHQTPTEGSPLDPHEPAGAVHDVGRLEPVPAAEEQVEAAREDDHERRRGDEAPGAGGAGIGDVHAVVAGDEGGHGDDGRPASDLLHDLVLAVVAQAEVGLDDGADEVAERVGGLADAQDVVVDVLVVGVQLVGDRGARAA